MGADWGKRVGYGNIHGFRSVAVGRLGYSGLMTQDGLRQAFEAIEQGPQFSILVRRGAKHGHHLACEFHVDGFALGLVAPLVRAVAFGWVLTASALLPHFIIGAPSGDQPVPIEEGKVEGPISLSRRGRLPTSER